MKKNIGKYWVKYLFRELPILYREKSIRCNTWRYIFFIRDFQFQFQFSFLIFSFNSQF